MIGNILKHALIFFGVALPLMVIGFFLLPVVFLFLPRDRETLPKFLRWFDNHQAHAAGLPKATSYHIKYTDVDGLIGPKEWRYVTGRWPAYPYVNTGFWRHWYQRVRWTAFRNPTNYFKDQILGITVPNVFVTKIFTGTTYKLTYTKPLTGRLKKFQHFSQITDAGDPFVAGHKRMEMNFGDKKPFEYYWISPLYKLFGKHKCIRIRIGWKMGRPDQLEEGDKLAWVFAVGPFKNVEVHPSLLKEE